jgi:hypothetical protein
MANIKTFSVYELWCEQTCIKKLIQREVLPSRDFLIVRVAMHIRKVIARFQRLKE